MAIDKLNENLNIISALDDEPNDVGGLTSEQVKGEFDKSGNIIKDYINDTLIPNLDAENLPLQYGVEGGQSIKEAMDGIVLGEIPDGSLSEIKLDADLREKVISEGQVGDIQITTRKDLSDNWLYCNRAFVRKSDWPELEPILPDAVEVLWNLSTLGTSSRYGVVYGDGYWVAVGGSGDIYWTTDPTGPWTLNKQGTTSFISIAYGDGYWVAIAATASNNTWWATDPTGTWTQGAASGTARRAITYANGYWVSVGDSGSIRVASDPAGAWLNITAGSGQLTSVAYGNGYWVASGGGGTYWTTNPTGAWTLNSQSGRNFSSLVYADGSWAGLSNSEWEIWTVTDPFGIWALRSKVPNASSTVMNYVNGYWIVVSGGGGEMWWATSLDGPWTLNVQGTGGYYAVSYANGYRFLCGSGGVLRWVDERDMALPDTAAIGAPAYILGRSSTNE